MSGERDHDQVRELLGAYALGAVNAHEQAIIEDHLETCGPCLAELDDYRQLAEALRVHAARVSPLASAAPNGQATATGEPHSGARLARRWRLPVAMVIVAVLLGGLLADARLRSDALEARIDLIELLARAQLATADPAALLTTLRTPSNDDVLTVVSRAGGGATYAMNGPLPRLRKDRTYQLWRVDEKGETAAVTIGSRLDAVGFSMPPGVTEFLLTIEKEPIPSRPTLPAVAAGRVAAGNGEGG